MCVDDYNTRIFPRTFAYVRAHEETLAEKARRDKTKNVNIRRCMSSADPVDTLKVWRPLEYSPDKGRLKSSFRTKKDDETALSVLRDVAGEIVAVARGESCTTPSQVKYAVGLPANSL